MHKIKINFRFVLLLQVVFFLFQGLYSQDTAVIKNGYQKFYYKSKVLSSEGTMRNGQPDGYWKAYYENGKLKSEGNRKNFDLDSLWIFYSEKGQRLLDVNYKDGKKNGIKTTYLEQEMIREMFKNDIKEGFSRYYYPDGKIKMEIRLHISTFAIDLTQPCRRNGD